MTLQTRGASIETVVSIFIGTFAVALMTGVLAFARERLNKADVAMDKCQADVLWYRDKLLPALERQQDILEHRQNILEHQQRILDAVERRMGNDNL